MASELLSLLQEATRVSQQVQRMRHSQFRGGGGAQDDEAERRLIVGEKFVTDNNAALLSLLKSRVSSLSTAQLADVVDALKDYMLTQNEDQSMAKRLHEAEREANVANMRAMALKRALYIKDQVGPGGEVPLPRALTSTLEEAVPETPGGVKGEQTIRNERDEDESESWSEAITKGFNENDSGTIEGAVYDKIVQSMSEAGVTALDTKVDDTLKALYATFSDSAVQMQKNKMLEGVREMIMKKVLIAFALSLSGTAVGAAAVAAAGAGALADPATANGVIIYLVKAHIVSLAIRPLKQENVLVKVYKAVARKFGVSSSAPAPAAAPALPGASSSAEARLIADTATFVQDLYKDVDAVTTKLMSRVDPETVFSSSKTALGALTEKILTEVLNNLLPSSQKPVVSSFSGGVWPFSTGSGDDEGTVGDWAEETARVVREGTRTLAPANYDMLFRLQQQGLPPRVAERTQASASASAPTPTPARARAPAPVQGGGLVAMGESVVLFTQASLNSLVLASVGTCTKAVTDLASFMLWSVIIKGFKVLGVVALVGVSAWYASGIIPWLLGTGSFQGIINVVIDIFTSILGFVSGTAVKVIGSETVQKTALQVLWAGMNAYRTVLMGYVSAIYTTAMANALLSGGVVTGGGVVYVVYKIFLRLKNFFYDRGALARLIVSGSGGSGEMSWKEEIKHAIADYVLLLLSIPFQLTHKTIGVGLRMVLAALRKAVNVASSLFDFLWEKLAAWWNSTPGVDSEEGDEVELQGGAMPSAWTVVKITVLIALIVAGFTSGMTAVGTIQVLFKYNSYMNWAKMIFNFIVRTLGIPKWQIVGGGGGEDDGSSCWGGLEEYLDELDVVSPSVLLLGGMAASPPSAHNFYPLNRQITCTLTSLT